ncbi:MAG TPA: DUF3159 domain-containing protein [Jatrophihabitans sp.]|nr:DUF3159 domain-containing protein [Jatrophihabitans sp.]
MTQRKEELRETYRQQLLVGIGGWTGALITAIPTVVFVIVNVTASLRAAIVAAVGAALLLTGYRLLRRQSIQQSLSGLFGVAVAAFIAARTGQARGYFLFGIWTSFAYAVPFGISVLVRRPLVGLLWEFLDPTPAGPIPGGDSVATGDAASAEHVAARPWYRRRPLLVAYTWATLAATAVFLARGFVQLALYGHNATGWLAFARIAMGYPLFIAAVGFSFLVVTRARHGLAAAAG